MNKATAISFLLLLTCLALPAQGPGYLGRKSIIKIDGYGILASNDYRYNNAGIDGTWALGRINAGLEQITSRRNVLGLMAEYAQAGNPYAFDIRAPQGTGYGSTKIRMFGFALSLKRFPFLTAGRLAPIGPYFQVDACVRYATSKFYNDLRPTSGFPIGGHAHTGLGFSVGYETIVKSHLVLDLGMRLGFSDMRRMLFNGVTQKEHIINEDAGVLFTTDVFRLKLGIGWLLGK